MEPTLSKVRRRRPGTRAAGKIERRKISEVDQEVLEEALPRYAVDRVG